MSDGKYFGKLYRKKKTGQGEFIDNNGNYYIGEFKNDKKQGVGI